MNNFDEAKRLFEENLEEMKRHGASDTLISAGMSPGIEYIEKHA